MSDYHQIGPHRLYYGDAYAIRPTLGFMDCDVMDPPYKFNNSGGGAFRKARGASDQIVDEKLDRGFDHVIIDAALSGSVFIFCHQNQIDGLVPELVGYEGFFDTMMVADIFAAVKPKFKSATLINWIKPNPSPMANKNYLADIEPYIHAWSDGYHPIGDHHDKHRHITCQSVRGKKLYGHPTVKPEAVMDKIMTNMNGQTVCDPFMGTGSTGVAAIKAGKTFTGIEHNPTHFKTAIKRITEAFEDIK